MNLILSSESASMLDNLLLKNEMMSDIILTMVSGEESFHLLCKAAQYTISRKDSPHWWGCTNQPMHNYEINLSLMEVIQIKPKEPHIPIEEYHWR